MRKLLITCGLIISSSFAFSQTKIGYINSNEISSNFPELKIIDSTLIEYNNNLQTQFNKMVEIFNKDVSNYVRDSSKLTKDAKKFAEIQLGEKKNNLEQFQQMAQDSIMSKRRIMYQPYIDKINNAVKQIATEGGYDYIYDKASNTFIYINDNINNLQNKLKNILSIK